MRKYALIISTVILILLFLRLSFNYNYRFEKVNNAYGMKSVNLAPGAEPGQISDAMRWLETIDEKDAAFAAAQISERLNSGEKLGALSDLNKRAWQVPAPVIESQGSEYYKKALAESRNLLGQDEEFRKALGVSAPSSVQINPKEEGKIKVHISHEDEKASPLSKALRLDRKPSEGVMVRLSEHYIDSLSAERKTLAWARTDEKGNVTFSGLDPDLSYSVLPIREGYEYGVPKGTVKGSLKQNGTVENYKFDEKDHRIRLFDNPTVARIKDLHIFTLRTPKEYKKTVAVYFVFFILAWWLLYMVYAWRKKNNDSSFIAILMLLTGICVLLMFSLNDPLEDRLIGVDMTCGVIAGVVIMGILQFVDFTGLYQNRSKIGFDIPFEIISWLFKPFRRKVSYLTAVMSDRRKNVVVKLISTLCVVICLPLLVLDLIGLTKLSPKIEKFLARFPKGSGYLLAALILTALLWTPLGGSVGGMRVNLHMFGIRFQPSEIAKYLIIFFMAAFFTLGASKIMKYSDRGNVGLFKNKIRMLSALIVGLLIIMGMYLILGDMGPGLVLALTFIILYSLVKSKIDLDGVADKKKAGIILKSDLAMLVYGSVTFVVFLLVGQYLDLMALFCVLWFVAWVAFGLFRRQIFESAILFNLIIAAFVFGGDLMQGMPFESFREVGERLEGRNEMASNTWGTLPLDGHLADAGENSQVAEGLWGLASGGVTGQGLGNGSPNFIPAFHTDMILASLGEQLGFIGILTVVCLLALLLRRSVIIGYRARHPFAFYLCLGIAIVTGVQFVVIALGSTGIIPLTGVTVPFLSFGSVSMILNLVAFGIILSYNDPKPVDKSSVSEASVHNMKRYNYSISLLSWMFCGVALVIIGVFFYYQIVDRNNTLIRPVFVNDSRGAPVLEYNPRIARITDKMWAGNIYDRNGILMATSDRSKLPQYDTYYKQLDLKYDTTRTQKRYYPFGDHMAFMLGEYGSDLYNFTSEFTGYTAEYRHLSRLRGFDNTKYDEKGKPIKVSLSSDRFKPGAFSRMLNDTLSYPLRDYTALIPYLKAGYNSGRVERMNARNEKSWEIGQIKPEDIYLTVDSRLQTLLQQRLEDHIRRNHAGLGKVRASVVVLDAANGDLLSSAVYPLPDASRLKEANGATYNDMNKPQTWKAYSDMDLGLFFPTAPGSTAKVLTGLAGFRKYGNAIADKSYQVFEEEKIFPGEPSGLITMRDAYRYSSNVYFVNLLNDNDLYSPLSRVYGHTGISINGKKAYGINYESPSQEWLNMVTAPSFDAVNAYIKYKEKGVKEKMNKGKPTSWSWAWGQYGIDATPLAMARAMSVVANGGIMPKTRFLLTDTIEKIKIVENTDILRDYLKFTAEGHDKFIGMPWLGGKTGTPERITNSRTIKRTLNDGSVKFYTVGNKTVNDGWYVCFIENARIPSKNGTITSPLAIAIRLERIQDGMSGKAVEVMKSVVLGTLRQLNYIQ